MRLQKVYRLILFVAFFLCLHILLRFWAMDAGTLAVACNYGGPLGVTLPRGVFIPVFLGVSVFLVVQWWREESFLSEWPWLLIFSGGLGNLWERFFFGCVTDYFALPFFPVFNIADILLTLGTLSIIIRWSQGIAKNQDI